MQAIRAVSEVDQDGMARVQVPPSFGRRVELIVLPAGESEEKSFSHVLSTQLHGDDIYFTAAAYLAAVEDDESEDDIWESYLNEQF